ncbi:MAG TPA: ferric reductase-like transmembrane domain-containing protein [Patescibacteria group bacterium]|nr:ferric reductase-like transmembrane domain-containing protein [Patescibacteria group bacterium]
MKNSTGLVKFFYPLLLIIPVILVFSVDTVNPTYYKFAKSYGIAAITLGLFQLVLSSRNKILDRLFGYPNVLILHSLNAKIVLLFAIAHPTMIFFSYINDFKFDLRQIIESITFPYWLGVIALTGLLVTVFGAMYSGKLKLKYEFWKKLHRFIYLILIIVLVHAFLLGSDFLHRNVVFYYVLGFIILAVLSFLDRYFHIFGKKIYEYTVTEVKKQNNEVFSYILHPANNSKALKYNPGQFVFTHFYDSHVPKEEHHFTISGYSEDGEVMLTVKKVGDYTKILPDITKGSNVKLEGPYGNLSVVRYGPPYVFIAAGIGITPSFSNLLYLEEKNALKNAFLILSNKIYKDIVFKDDLSRLKKKGLKTAFFLTQEKRLNYINSRIDARLLKKILKGKKGATYFVTGGQEFVLEIEKQLIEIGIKRYKINKEIFSLK